MLLRIANFRVADLTPPLGYPGGPCQVIERIQERVTNPRHLENLVQKVEEGLGLSKEEELRIYRADMPERGVAGTQVKWVAISPHAQYRMDLRGVVVTEVLLVLKSFFTLLNKEKSKASASYKRWALEIQKGDKITWDSHGVAVTFVAHLDRKGDVGALVVTVVRQGQGDDGVDRKDCHPFEGWVTQDKDTFLEQLKRLAGQYEELPLGKVTAPDEQPPATPPAAGPEWGAHGFNSGEGILPRTPASPGDGGDESVLFDSINQKFAWERRWKPGKRQKRQRGKAKQRSRQYYQKNRARILAKQRQRRSRNKNNSSRQRSERQRRQQNRRRLASWTFWADYAPPSELGGKDGDPQREQPREEQREDRNRHRRQRSENNRDDLRRYHEECKRDTNCMKRREEYREDPKKYRRRPAKTGNVLLTPDIFFTLGVGGQGTVHSVSALTGMVTYFLDLPGGRQRLDSMPVWVFLWVATLLTEEDLQSFIQLVDEEVGEEAYLDMDAELLEECLRVWKLDPSALSVCGQIDGEDVELLLEWAEETTFGKLP